MSLQRKREPEKNEEESKLPESTFRQTDFTPLSKKKESSTLVKEKVGEEPIEKEE